MSKKISENDVLKIFYVLIFLDFSFILLHGLIRTNIIGLSDYFLINQDQGLPELFQYLKYFIVIIISIILIFKYNRVFYLFWLFLFSFFLLDDAFSIHEKAGIKLASFFNLPNYVKGVSSENIGEGILFGLVLLILLVPGIWGFFRAGTIFKKTSFDLLILCGLFVFFGTVVDIAHSFFTSINQIVGGFFTLIEEGGEMLCMSLILIYFIILLKQSGDNKNHVFSNPF